MRLWLLRHAAVRLPPGICYGATDVAADESATCTAARAAAAQLPAGLPVRVSALGRARALARQLQTLRPDLGVAVIDERLNEMDFGCWELKPWNDIPRACIDAWAADFESHRFGGRESAGGVIARVAEALVATSTSAGPAAQALWITHAGVIRALHHLSQRGAGSAAAATHWPRVEVPYGSLVALDLGQGA